MAGRHIRGLLEKVGIYAAGYYETFPKVPITFMSSWYDVYVPTTLENFMALKGDPDRPLTLIMGPWTHGNRTRSVFGDVDFGPAAIFDGRSIRTGLPIVRTGLPAICKERQQKTGKGRSICS